MFASFRIYLYTIGYNTSLVTAEEAPKSYADLLDPKWKGKIVKSHPSYSGGTLTSTFQVARDVGWDYFESSPGRTSCRCNRRPIRPRSWRSASAPSWSTARTTS